MEDDPFLNQEDERAVVTAIASAERRTSAQIRVLVTHQRVENPLQTAHAALHRFGMTRTRHRNAVLLLVSPTSRKFAVAGDVAAHEKLGDAVWRSVVSHLEDGFAAGHACAALERAVGALTDLLAQDFPPETGGSNELPDEIVRE